MSQEATQTAKGRCRLCFFRTERERETGRASEPLHPAVIGAGKKKRNNNNNHNKEK